MIRIKNILLFFLILAVPFAVTAQDQEKAYRITGYITGTDNKPVTDAAIDLVNAEKLIIQSVYADEKGYFELENVAPGDYTVVFFGYAYEEMRLPVSVQAADVSMNTVAFTKSSGETLEGVRFRSDRLAVQQKEDTAQYDASAFKTNPDATAEDLLRKMPGMDMSSGTPKTQGENVTKVLVDGKPFFGDDPTAALKNLPAEVIDKIQVYDERSEQSQFSGFDDGNTSKTINIMTRKDRKEGVFGKLYVGGGMDVPDDKSSNTFRFSNGGVVNYFKGSRRISLMGINNNINQQNFSSQDIIGSGSGASGGRGMRGGGMGAGGRGGGGMQSNNMMGSSQGINRTNGVGINYSDVWKEKVEVTASYMFNDKENNTTQDINRMFVLPEQAGQTYGENSRSTSNNASHRFNGRLKWSIDSSNMLLLMPSLSYQDNKSISNSFAQTLLDQSFLNNSTNENDNRSHGLNAGLRALYSHKFKKTGRTASLWLDGGYTGNESTNRLYALNQYLDASLNDTLDQMARNEKAGYNLNAHLSYTEPLSRISSIQFRYKYGYNNNSSDKKTYSRDYAEAYSLLDTTLSNVYATSYITNGAELSYRMMLKKLEFNAGLELQSAVLSGERTMPQTSKIYNDFLNLLPSARVRYNISKTQNFRMFFRSYSRNPSVDQLQDVINNTNPLQLTSGNSALDQSVNYDLNSMFSSTSAKNNSTFFAMLRASIVDNYIGNNTTVAREDMTIRGIQLPKGAQYSRPVNIDGYKSLNTFLTYGQLVSPIRTNVNVNLTGGYTITPGLINEVKNEARTAAVGAGIVLSSNISENVDYTLSTTGSYSKVNNTLNTAANNEFYNQASRFSLNYIFFKGIVFNTELNHQLYTGLSQDFNQSFFLWNASLGKKILKNQAEIKVQVYDILGQNAAVSRAFTELYTEDTRTNVLQRYFLLTFTWNLRFFKGGASEKDMKGDDTYRGPGGPGMQGPPPGMVPPHR